MSNNPMHLHGATGATIAKQAALWLARRDRGLTPAEQDEYLQWLAADARHAESLTQHAAAFERMMKLYEWQPGHSAEPNVDLFAPPRRRQWRTFAITLAAAAAIVISGAAWWLNPPSRDPALAATSYLRVNESQALPDGSMVELNDGSRITVEFTALERRVRLVGEAHFKVAKNPVPFVVDAGGIAVRAVGTAFNVRVDADAVEVLVTEGTVRVDNPAGKPFAAERTGAGAGAEVAGATDEGQNLIVAGQRAVVPLARAAEIRVSDVSGAERRAALAWQTPRLQFFETPLAVAVAEFNQRNRNTRLVIADRELEAVPIGGTFRIDNVEAFARLLEVTLDLHAEPRGAEIVITRAR